MTAAGDGPRTIQVREVGLTRTREPAPERLAPEAFLRRARAWPRGFWQRGDLWTAWAGAARVLEAEGEDRFAAVRRVADSLRRAAGADPEADGIRFHGGFSFLPRVAEDRVWRGFPAARFVLPALELERSPGGSVLSATGERGAARLEAVRAEGEREEPEPGADGTRGPGAPRTAVAEIREPRDRPAWEAAVRRILRAIEAGEASKVVLARTLELTLPVAPDPPALVARLRALNPRGYLFLFEPVPGTLFLAAAPELLGALRGRSFHATAVAGTAARGRDPAEDEALARRLLESPKDREEHEIGVRDTRERLGRVAPGARVDQEPRVVRLNGVQHLRTDLFLSLPERHHILELLEALHPTAAVGGYPREPALRLLGREEGFERGWYAAPAGWFDLGGDGEFAPGLRSAVIEGSRAWLFAGAGIVRGSDPGREWEETRLKFGPVLEVLGLDPPR